MFTRAPGWAGVWDGTRGFRAEPSRERYECVPTSMRFRHEALTHA
jgi:hypothetical protein